MTSASMKTRSLTVLLTLASAPLAAQSLPFLDGPSVRLLSQEITGDAAFRHIRYLSQLHRPRVSEKLWQTAEYVADQARLAGLSRVAIIKQPFSQPPWNSHFADLWLTGARPERIASTLQNDVHVIEHSRPTDITATLVDVGSGSEAELTGTEVSGKIVVTRGDHREALRRAVWQRGALGVIAYPDPAAAPDGIVGAGLGRPDQVPWLQFPRTGESGRAPTFGFSLSLRQGLDLVRKIRTSPTPVMAHAVVRADSGAGERSAPWQVLVEGYLQGTDPGGGQEVVLTAHLQEEQHSANDDGSGIANLLEIGRALTKLIDEGKLARPKRSIRFWWTTEIGGERQYFADHPDAAKSMWVAINQDMAGAEQTIDLTRKQDITRLPAYNFHFFNDVAESVTEYLVATNTIYLSAIRNGTPFYPDPIFAHNGSQHRYAAEMVWYHEDSDHQTFNEQPIRVPAITFTNMPDRFIHSNEDDLWNVDPTQLGRNAVSAALMAFTMASASPATAPALTAETVGRGEERIGRNIRLALQRIAAAPGADSTFFGAVDQLDFALARERLAVRSLAGIAPTVDVGALLAALDRRVAEAKVRVRDAWISSAGRSTPATRALSEPERRLAGLRPTIVGGPREFLGKRLTVEPVGGLNPMMQSAAYGWIDGQRTGLDIFRLVAAEAREAGVLYYGTVTAGQVLQALEGLAGTGLAALR